MAINTVHCCLRQLLFCRFWRGFEQTGKQSSSVCLWFLCLSRCRQGFKQLANKQLKCFCVNASIFQVPTLLKNAGKQWSALLINNANFISTVMFFGVRRGFEEWKKTFSSFFLNWRVFQGPTGPRRVEKTIQFTFLNWSVFQRSDETLKSLNKVQFTILFGTEGFFQGPTRPWRGEQKH